MISGTGSFTKARNGTLELTGQSTYSGTTTISGGDIIISISNALPSNPLTFTNTANIYIFDSSITQTIGTLSASGVTGAKIDSAGTLTINQNANGIYSGRIIGTGAVVKSGSYILTLNGTNTYQGGTTISEGTLRVSGGNALLNSGSVILADVSGALLDVITSETIGSLSGGGIHGGTTYGNIAVASGATLTVNQTINRIFSGTISGAGAF
ncbi:MAG: autotransporter outer membrane beta-barrel domain-containing protein, partial [Verrucomicrobia bacterium]|nr:autotransporter outer membrane beta-barrel domain-containing protein [Verrucomicrobiota bacterium]